MAFWLVELIGGCTVSYVLLRLVMLAFRSRKFETPSILISGLIVLVVATVVGGYGLRDGGPSPLFLVAFASYLPAVLLALVIELARGRGKLSV